MESFGDSNCPSISDSFSLYERYLRSFSVVDSFVEENREATEQAPPESPHREYENSHEGNIDLSVNKHYETAEAKCNNLSLVCDYDNIDVEKIPLEFENDLCPKIEDTNLTSPAASFLDNSSATAEHSITTEKSEVTDVPVSSEESKSDFKHPIFITSTMENSNNAVDSVPLFRDIKPSESVFKLPIRELSFNGTLKHVQKLKPIVDPISAFTSNAELVLEDKTEANAEVFAKSDSSNVTIEEEERNASSDKMTDTSNGSSDTNRAGVVEKVNESTGDSQYEEVNKNAQSVLNEETKWNESYSSLEASFDSGVRSPDMFSDEDDEPAQVEEAPEQFWGYLKDAEAFDKRKLRKLEERLQGVLPPPSVTNLKTDVTEMLKKYYCFLPAFSDEVKVDTSKTPTKRVSFIEVPEIMQAKSEEQLQDDMSSISKEIKTELDTSTDKSIDLKMGTEIEARELSWPEVSKFRYYDVYYNLTQYSEKFELLAQKYAERFVGAETDSSINIHSGGLQSPSSASKRKALRLQAAQTKSPGRRLSHLARRRQAFCSAATINEKAQSSGSRMVYIDKNFFPHRKFITSADRKSPRTRRTPGKRTPMRKTPGKKTPTKTPRSSSTKKKAMRRLLMDSDNITRSQPRESLKRALFVSPVNRKSVPQVESTSAPAQAMKSKRALFGSPVTAETKSCDGTQSDQFLKRKRDFNDEGDNNRCKIAKSLSFGGDNIGSSQTPTFGRRASEVYTNKNSAELSEIHRKKLLWAVSEALRVHGWRLSCPGFREKASALARLTRKLLSLPPHAAKLAAPKLSTSETMLKLARQYVFAIIQGRTVEDCFQEEQMKIANESTKITGYISATAYQQLKTRQASTSTFTSQIKENYSQIVKQEQPRSASKNVLQDKLVNIDSSSNSNSNSSSGLSLIDRMDKSALFKSNSMPSFEEAKMRARRQISFDNVEFPKR